MCIGREIDEADYRYIEDYCLIVEDSSSVVTVQGSLKCYLNKDSIGHVLSNEKTIS